MIFENGTLYPLEIKSTSNPTPSMTKAFDIIDTIPGINRGEGGVICLSKTLLPLKNDDKIIPFWAI